VLNIFTPGASLKQLNKLAQIKRIIWFQEAAFQTENCKQRKQKDQKKICIYLTSSSYPS